MLVAVKSSNRNLLSDSTSGLSVKLSSGKLDPREALSEINRTLSRRSLATTQRNYLQGVKRQILFREFARSALQVQTYKCPAGARDKDSAEYRQLIKCRTGIPIVDAAVMDLKHGLPHNRARLLLARFAIRNLNLDPVEVAALFKKYLRDYSPVVNTFNIVSAASAAVFAEPWFRLSNPVTAAKLLDPKNEYLARFALELAKPTAAGLRSIREGSRLWIARWKAAQEHGEFVRRNLWPTRDRERGLYFILDRISARGAFAPYYNRYLLHEDKLLNS
jgi:deoxyribodipyrimidine photolyase